EPSRPTGFRHSRRPERVVRALLPCRAAPGRLSAAGRVRSVLRVDGARSGHIGAGCGRARRGGARGRHAMNPKARQQLHYAGALLWLLVTVSLASWWLVFGLEQARQLRDLQAPQAQALSTVQRMLVWEGATFIALLVVGGVALVISV